ncbi:PEP/pyruvate-binding domain-containing protein [Actinomadura sp. NPDC048955]|uniref:PEP/pyruvate-binding domain-containing protein n=1 Tax=Actinomadura sp. NPDC048955 TaxID=3158228 RepID=UPI003406C0D6
MTTEFPELSSLTENDRQRVGGKAAGLGELHDLGLPVPRGFVVPADVLAMQDESGLAKLLESAIAERGLCPPFAVRSSAVAEDGAHASFAGQFATELGVSGTGLAGAVLRCASSADHQNVSYYAEAVGGQQGDHLRVSVIVQELVAADLSAVMFTADPLTGDPDTYVLEVVRGPGASLVGGMTEPFTVRVFADGMEVVNRPDWADTRIEARVLGLSGRLRAMGRAITRHRGAPQDVELCVTADDLVIPVQTRAITSLPSTARRSFTLRYVEVGLATRSALGDLAERDKVRLRMVAESGGLSVGRAWIICAAATPDRCSTSGDSVDPPPPADLRAVPQISFVLQDPARLSGAIVRRFSAAAGRIADLEAMVQIVGRAHDRFALIATEIRQARLSGVARRFGEKILIEVGFGAFVPKGVVATSQYVCSLDGEILQCEPTVQEHLFLIEDGQARTERIDQVPELSAAHCRSVAKAVEVANEHYINPSVEFGVDEPGTFFLIDFVEESAEGAEPRPDNLSVLSPGHFRGRVVRVEDDQVLMHDSLDAHFHNDRPGDESTGSDDPVVVVARLPYLSLERFMRQRDPRSMAFVFRNGSYLSHLSIVLRELGIPAIVDAEAYEALRVDEHVVVDTGSGKVSTASRHEEAR